jgi:putative ABC transport system permease protein
MRTLKFGLRMLVRTPFVSTVAILSLGLGIGANTAMFSLLNQILLQPLPVSAPGELVNLGAPGPKNGSTSCNQAGNCDAVFSYPMFRDLARAQTPFTGIAAHWLFSANIGYRNQTINESGLQVSGSYFGVLGLRPAVGRLLGAQDDATVGETHVAVLSHEYWRRRFNADPGVVGETLVVNGQPLGVVGVAPEGFHGTTRGFRPKIFVPITLRGLMEPPFADFENRRSYWVYLFARLKPGISMPQATSDINGPYHALINDADLPLQQGLDPARAAEFKAKRVTLEDGRRGQSSIFSGARTPLLVLFSLTAIVLLIACANIANLLLARAASRATEMAVRLSIGASRGQLVRQLLVESCLLAVMGGVAGLLFMNWTMTLVLSQLPPQAATTAAPGLNLAVLGFAAALSLVTGVLFGLFPAIHSTRPDLVTSLKAQAGQPSGAKAAARFRAALVVAQIALSMGLLTCAGLFAKSLVNVARVELGITSDHLITFSLSPRRNGYSQDRVRAFFEDVEQRLAATPGILSVGVARVPVVAGSNSNTGIDVEGYVQAPASRTGTSYNEISPGFFRTVGMTLLAGREFSLADSADAPKVAIVNEAFARRYNLGASVVGRRMRRGGTATDPYDIEIVGLVRDAKYSQVRADVPAVFFIPYRQNRTLATLTFYARTGLDPERMIGGIAPLVAALDPNLPVDRLRTMEQQIAENTQQDRTLGIVSASFAGLATLLASIGLYGVLAYTVSQRTREFGVRLALGADPANVRRLVLRQVMWMTIVGGLVGLGLAIGVGRLAASLLFQLQSYDPVVLAASTIVLTAVAFGAGFVPALRASRVDPMRALRYE